MREKRCNVDFRDLRADISHVQLTDYTRTHAAAIT